jgi:hypothetical protein
MKRIVENGNVLVCTEAIERKMRLERRAKSIETSVKTVLDRCVDTILAPGRYKIFEGKYPTRFYLENIDGGESFEMDEMQYKQLMNYYIVKKPQQLYWEHKQKRTLKQKARQAQST